MFKKKVETKPDRTDFIVHMTYDLPYKDIFAIQRPANLTYANEIAQARRKTLLSPQVMLQQTIE